jgi:DNA-binding phage protein
VINRSAIDLAIAEIEELEQCCAGPRTSDSALLRSRTVARARLAVLALQYAVGFRATPELKDVRESNSVDVTRRGAQTSRRGWNRTEAPDTWSPYPSSRVDAAFNAIGKEVIIDPTDTLEDFTADMLSATNVLEYRNSHEKLEALRAAVAAAGIKRIARTSGVSRSHLQGLSVRGLCQTPRTIARIEVALAALNR